MRRGQRIRLSHGPFRQLGWGRIPAVSGAVWWRADRTKQSDSEGHWHAGDIELVVDRLSPVSDSRGDVAQQRERADHEHHAVDLHLDGQPGQLLGPRAVDEWDDDEWIV